MRRYLYFLDQARDSNEPASRAGKEPRRVCAELGLARTAILQNVLLMDARAVS